MMIEILKDIANDIKEKSDNSIDINVYIKNLEEEYNPDNNKSAKVIKEYTSNT